MHKFFASLAAILIASALSGCATQASIPALDNEPPATEQQVAERQRMMSEKRAMQPGPGERFDIVVVGGTCAPKTSAKFAVTSCVNEQPCNGHGLRGEDGKVSCACFSVRGGCSADTFCHNRSRSCVKLPADTYHAQ